MVQSLVQLHMVQTPSMCFCVRDPTCVDSNSLLPWVALTPGYWYSSKHVTYSCLYVTIHFPTQILMETNCPSQILLRH